MYKYKQPRIWAPDSGRPTGFEIRGPAFIHFLHHVFDVSIFSIELHHYFAFMNHNCSYFYIMFFLFFCICFIHSKFVYTMFLNFLLFVVKPSDLTIVCPGIEPGTLRSQDRMLGRWAALSREGKRPACRDLFHMCLSLSIYICV